MRIFSHFAPFALALALTAHASTPVQPTTTLAAETGNNTSAAGTFLAQSNGNAGAGNVSKLPLRDLLYNGANTKIYVHYMPWFGTSYHMNIGMDESQPAVVQRQVADMMSRGVNGAIVDWYGPSNTHHNTTTINMMNAAQASGGKFTFAITEDSGALKSCANTTGCDITQQLISDLTYVYKTFEPSPAYLRIDGRPVIFFFGTDAYTIDWTRVRANTPGNPLFIFRNSGAFGKVESDGGFSWLGISGDPNNMGLSYLDGFYSTALRYPTKNLFGSGYKGFNDTLASWGKNRIVNQQCGQTWLKSWAEAGKYFSSGAQMPALQVVTWNDYEEGSEIETGIDNCVAVTAWMSGSTLNWSITGDESTVDHYTVFISLDGQNLMPVTDAPVGTSWIDLGSYGFGPANYTLFVKAVGKPSLTNKMSQAVTWAVPNQPPIPNLVLTPQSGIAPVSVSADASASTDLDGKIVSTTIDFGDGTVVNESSSTHTFSNPGTYLVRVMITDDLGATATSGSNVTIVANQPPQARLSLTPASGTAPLTVTADASTSSDSDGKIASTTIDFGDGTISSGPTATHTYSAAGSYTVKATVTDDRGASSIASATVSALAANKPPVLTLSVSPTTGTVPIVVNAKVSASDPDGSVAYVTINWGDGSTSSSSNASHTYTKAGSFVITATATDNKGAITSTSTTVLLQWGIMVISPTPNSTSTSPVHVTATASSSAPITCIKVYVDGVVKYSINNVSKIDTWVKMAKGTRRITVQSWDSAGTVNKSTLYISVK